MMNADNNSLLTANVLVVDDNETHADTLQEGLERVGHRCEVAYNVEQALQKFQRQTFQVLVTDLMLKESTGIELLKSVLQIRPNTVVLVITAHATIESAVQAMRDGAADYIEKPIQIEQLRLRIQRLLETRHLREENLQLHRQLDKTYGFADIVGNTPQMQKVFDVLGQIAQTDATILLLGESGTGKELVAKAIHNNSLRKKQRFVAINCAALSESLIESELFGHEKGAFTGAVAAQMGKIEYANGGTLFLDEVGDMPLSTQVKLLRVLEQREIVRVGSNKTTPVNIRLLAATNADLQERVKSAKFREDLYFRLHVVALQLPPLRERRADIPLLMQRFLNELAQVHRKKIKGFAPEVQIKLMQYAWPGNVRELRNCIENMVVITRDDILDMDDLPAWIHLGQTPTTPASGDYSLAGKSLQEVERDLIRMNLELVGGNREKAAKILGLGERTLYRKIKEYHL